MNFNVNSLSPTFKGMYVVEGTGKEVDSFEEMKQDLLFLLKENEE